MDNVLQLVTFDSIRAMIGIDAEEFSDDAMAALSLDEQLLSDLYSWLPSTTSYSDIVAGQGVGIPGDTGSLAYLALSGYSRAFCALLLMGTAENWRITQITDGTVSERRSDRVQLDKVVERLNGQMRVFKDRLLGLLDEDTSSSLTFTVMGKSTPGTDPVVDY